MNGMERLARAERDAVDLHAALSDAVRRMVHARSHLSKSEIAWADLYVVDLIAVLDRTSQPDPCEETPAARHAQMERARTPGGYVV